MRRKCRKRHPRHRGLARAVMHAGIAEERFPLKSVAGKRSRHPLCMRNPQFYVSGKRPISSFYNMVRTLIVWLDIHEGTAIKTE